jgi:hypothetical protein
MSQTKHTESGAIEENAVVEQLTLHTGRGPMDAQETQVATHYVGS